MTKKPLKRSSWEIMYVREAWVERVRAALTKQTVLFLMQGPAQCGRTGAIIPSPVILPSHQAGLTQLCWGAAAHSSLALMGSLPSSQKNTNMGAKFHQRGLPDYSFVKTLRLQVKVQLQVFSHGQEDHDFPILAPLRMTLLVNEKSQE